MKTNSLYIFKDIFKNKKPFQALKDFKESMDDFFNNPEGFNNGFTVHPSYLDKIANMDVKTLIYNVNTHKMNDLLGILSLAQLTDIYGTTKNPDDDLKNIFITYSHLFSEEFLLNKKEWNVYELLLNEKYKNGVDIDNIAPILPLYLTKFSKELKKQLIKDKQYEILLYLHTKHINQISLTEDEFFKYLTHVFQHMADKQKSTYLNFKDGNWHSSNYERFLSFILSDKNVEFLLSSSIKNDFLNFCVENKAAIQKTAKSAMAKTLIDWIQFVDSNYAIKKAVDHSYYLDAMNEKYKSITEKDYLNILLNAIEDIVINKKTGAINYSEFENQIFLFKNIINSHPEYKKIFLARAVCHDNLRYRVLWFLVHNNAEIPKNFTTKVTSDFLKNNWDSFNTGILYKDITTMRNTLNFLDVGIKWEIIEPHIMQLLNNQMLDKEADLYL